MKASISSRNVAGPEDGWNNYIAADETLLWSGRPRYGRRFFEVTGMERTWQIGLLIGAVAMWLTLPMIDGNGTLTAGDAVWVYSAITLIFLLVVCFMAVSRAYILGHLFYAVTDRRSMVRREGPNHFLAMRAFLISFEHSQDFAYEVERGRPYPSVKVGSLLSEEVVQPFGNGLTHPGWGPLRDRGVIPVLFEQIEDADAVRRLLVQTSISSGEGRS